VPAPTLVRKNRRSALREEHLGWRRLGKNGATVATVPSELHRSCISGWRDSSCAPEGADQSDGQGLCKIEATLLAQLDVCLI
jgi:hypothetical protein